jgi:predicted AlkP superfamily phosphohydrolase/phosphomutase/tetratricopeptide (TPR) repeat protein
MSKPKVLLIGWDAADWKVINPLLEKGELPALKSIIENGIMGNISTLEPAYSPMLWTTIATGKYPDKHGILGFSEPTPDHSSIRPVSNSSRKVKALWNILTQKGYKTHVVNWWPSFPAEPVNGIYVSNMYPKIKSANILDKRLPKDAVHPSDLQDFFGHFVIHPLELSLQHIKPFIPDADFSKQIEEKRFEIIAKNISEAASVQAAATLAMEQEEWDFAAVYWDTIDHFCHGFMNFAPPIMNGVKEEEFNLYKNVVDSAYRLMDMMLLSLLKLAGDNCNVILLSDHGYKSGALRQLHTPFEPAGPAFHHRNVGIFCAKGPNIKKDEILYGASLLDITPTVLALFDLPIGEDMDGKPLVEIFEEKPVISTVKSWEEISGFCGMLPDEKRDLDPEHSAEAIRQLIDLGYIEDPGENIKVAVERTVDELRYNLAQVYMGTQRYYQAKPILEALFEKNNHQGRFAFKLINCYFNEGNYSKAEEVIELFKKSAQGKVLSDEQVKLLKDRKVPEILEGKEREKWIKDVITTPVKEGRQAKNDLFQVKILEGDLLFKLGKPKKALLKYEEITDKKHKSRSYFSQMGRAYIKTKQWKKAEKMYRSLYELDPDSPNASLGLGLSYFNLKEFEKALDCMLDSATLNFYNYITHYNIGRTLFNLGDYENAASALEISLKINPNFGSARNLLIEVLEDKLDNKVRATIFRNPVSESIQDMIIQTAPEDELLIIPAVEQTDYEPIIIVSGLPRSGTSLMMQMLHAGGVSIFSDENRPADTNNPKGYFEHERVKQLIKNNRFLEDATGKAVKIVLPLLYKLPPRFKYKVIFMDREIHEIIESQHMMLVRNKKIKEGNYSLGIEETYKRYLSELDTWCKKNKNVEILRISYKNTIDDPAATARLIGGFINENVDLRQMEKAVLPELYRVKA